METAKFEITGKRPLMMHSTAGMKAPSVGKATKRAIPTPEEEAKLSAYILPSGQLYLKAEAFRASLRDASSGFKMEKLTLKRVFAASVFFPQEDNGECPLVDPKSGKPIEKYAIDTRRAVVQGQGVMRSRARVDAWRTLLRVEYDETIMDADQIEKFLKRAGSLIGIGDQRPGAPKTPGAFGTYSVKRA